MLAMMFRAAACAALLAAALPAAASDPAPAVPAAAPLSPAAAKAAAAVDAFHAALGRGDTAAALAFLAEEALIFEEGGAERSKAEYAGHHLAADAAFSQAVRAVTTRRTGAASGDFAWIASEARSTGTFKGRAVDRNVAETMVLRRGRDGWKIVHIHWSSAAAGGR